MKNKLNSSGLMDCSLFNSFIIPEPIAIVIIPTPADCQMILIESAYVRIVSLKGNQFQLPVLSLSFLLVHSYCLRFSDFLL